MDNALMQRRGAIDGMRIKSVVSAVLTAATVAACSTADSGATVGTPARAAGTPAPAAVTPDWAVPPRLAPHPCPHASGFTCSMLTVPLDHSGRVHGTLGLQVAVANNASAPRGVLLLTGGPGQPGVPFVPRLASRLAPVLHDYRLMMFDQRGTGQFGAINCPALGAAVGSSDIAVPPAPAVRACAHIIGQKRRFYSVAPGDWTAPVPGDSGPA